MARTIVTVAVRTLLSRLPEIRLAVPASDLRWNLSGLVWVPLSLPVTFTPQGPRATKGEGDPSSPPEGPRSHSPSGRALLSSPSSCPGKLLRGSRPPVTFFLAGSTHGNGPFARAVIARGENPRACMNRRDGGKSPTP